MKAILLSRTGKEAQALALARQAIVQQSYDYDLANSAFLLGWRAGDFALAIEAMRLRMKNYPETRVEGYVKLGNMYASGMKDSAKALGSFKQAMALASETQQRELWPQIPEVYRSQLGTPAVLQPPLLSKAPVRFRLGWNWNGGPAVLQSRATDDTGMVQPTRAALIAERGLRSVYHYNAIASWAIDEKGEAANAYV